MASLQEKFEYAAVRSLVGILGSVPRSWARAAGAAAGSLAFTLLGRLRRSGMRNLKLAYPQMPAAERINLLRHLYRNLGWQLAEFAQMRGYTSSNTQSFIRYDGLEHYLAARAAGKGVLIVTGHLGVWELSSFYHSLMGHPMSMVIRRLDNPLVDNFVNRLRCMHGNQVLDKDFVRGLLQAMHDGETVGILMDTNMTPPQGVFVPFFGVPSCTASGLARVALKTGATVLPGFMLWEPAEKKYVLRFGPQIELTQTGDDEADVVANTARFTQAIEDTVRQYPDQWLWLHRRWKTRPAGEPSIY